PGFARVWRERPGTGAEVYPSRPLRPTPSSLEPTPPPMTQVVLGQFLNGIIVVTLYGIIALGVTLTFGITGIVNFALGQFMMIGAYAAWHLTDITHLPYPVSVVLAVLISGLAGFLSDRALFQFTHNNLVNG